MGTALRKLVYIDGNIVKASDGSVDFDQGGLEGEANMASQGYAAADYKPLPGTVKLEVILDGTEDKKWWNKNIKRDIQVVFADVTGGRKGVAFSGMDCKTTFKSSGATAALEFCGPDGADIE
jgi:hypothetical protein